MIDKIWVRGRCGQRELGGCGDRDVFRKCYVLIDCRVTKSATRRERPSINPCWPARCPNGSTRWRTSRTSGLSSTSAISRLIPDEEIFIRLALHILYLLVFIFFSFPRAPSRSTKRAMTRRRRRNSSDSVSFFFFLFLTPDPECAWEDAISVESYKHFR